MSEFTQGFCCDLFVVSTTGTNHRLIFELIIVSAIGSFFFGGGGAYTKAVCKREMVNGTFSENEIQN